MKYLITVSTFILILFNSLTVHSQDRSTQFDVEVEPVAYILGGAGIHFGIQPGDWKYTLGYDLSVGGQRLF